MKRIQGCTTIPRLLKISYAPEEYMYETPSGGSANTYVNNAYYDSGSQNLRSEFGGDPLNPCVLAVLPYDIHNRFEILDDYAVIRSVGP